LDISCARFDALPAASIAPLHLWGVSLVSLVVHICAELFRRIQRDNGHLNGHILSSPRAWHGPWRLFRKRWMRPSIKHNFSERGRQIASMNIPLAYRSISGESDAFKLCRWRRHLLLFTSMLGRGRVFPIQGFEGESVHRLFLHAFLCFPDAQYVLSLFSTGVLCFTKIFFVVV
jgi:hypothetical protein